MEEVIEKLVKSIAKEIVGSGASAIGMSENVIAIYQKCLKRCTYSALIPFPGVASVALVTSVWSMYIEINKGFGLKFSDNVIKTIASGVSANLAGAGVGAVGGAIGESLKAIPGIGTILGAGVSALTNHTAMATSAMLYLKILEETIKANGRNVSDSDLLNKSKGKNGGKNKKPNAGGPAQTVYCANCGESYSSRQVKDGILDCVMCCHKGAPKGLTPSSSSYNSNGGFVSLRDVPNVSGRGSNSSSNGGFVSLRDVPNVTDRGSSSYNSNGGFVSLRDVPNVSGRGSNSSSNGGFVSLRNVPNVGSSAKVYCANCGESFPARQVKNGVLECPMCCHIGTPRY